MFGIFNRKSEVDTLISMVSEDTLKAWNTYINVYENLNSVEKKEVSIYMEKVFEDIFTTHPGLFQMEPMKYIQLLKNYNNVFGELSKKDRYMGLAGQMLITFFYAKGFCSASDVNAIGARVQGIKNMGK
jgi:hypothetical protein